VNFENIAGVGYRDGWSQYHLVAAGTSQCGQAEGKRNRQQNPPTT
jgi:hypothetical protein